MPSEEHLSTESVRTVAAFTSELLEFSGTEHHFRHPLGQLLYTDGVQHLARASEEVIADDGARNHGAYWLLDAIASHQPHARKCCDGFQLWTLTVTATADARRATLTCQPDSGQPPVITQEIDYTDFPLASITLYVVENVLLLPGEY